MQGALRRARHHARAAGERAASSPTIVEELLAFIDGSELIIHNAAFDVAFLDMELALLCALRVAAGLGRDRCARCSIR